MTLFLIWKNSILHHPLILPELPVGLTRVWEITVCFLSRAQKSLSLFLSFALSVSHRIGRSRIKGGFRYRFSCILAEETARSASSPFRSSLQVSFFFNSSQSSMNSLFSALETRISARFRSNPTHFCGFSGFSAWISRFLRFSGIFHTNVLSSLFPVCFFRSLS